MDRHFGCFGKRNLIHTSQSFMSSRPTFPPWLCYDVDPTRHTDPSVACWMLARRLPSTEQDHSVLESSGQQKASVPLTTGSEQKGTPPARLWVTNHRWTPRERKLFNKAILAGGAEPRADSGSVGEPGGNPVPRLSPALGVQRSLVAASSSLPKPHTSWFWGSGEWASVGTILLSMGGHPTHSEPGAWFREGDILRCPSMALLCLVLSLGFFGFEP